MVNESDLMAARMAAMGIGVAFALAAIAGIFVNYGIAIGFAVGAIVCFIAAHQFPALANAKWRWPFTEEKIQQRSYWNVFLFVSYSSLGIAIVLAIVFGTGFYLSDLKGQLRSEQERSAVLAGVAQRHLTDKQREKLRAALAPLASKIHTISVFGGSGEEGRYGNDFADVMREVNITPFGAYIGYYPGENERGVLVGLSNIDHPSDNAIAFIKALEDAGLKPTRSSIPARNLNDVNMSGNDFDLLIGPP